MENPNARQARMADHTMGWVAMKTTARYELPPAKHCLRIKKKKCCLNLYYPNGICVAPNSFRLLRRQPLLPQVKDKSADKAKRTSSSGSNDPKRGRQDGAVRKASENASGDHENTFCVVVDREWQADKGFRVLELQSISDADKDGNCEALARYVGLDGKKKRPKDATLPNLLKLAVNIS
jgi:hypothetical protein